MRVKGKAGLNRIGLDTILEILTHQKPRRHLLSETQSVKHRPIVKSKVFLDCSRPVKVPCSLCVEP